MKEEYKKWISESKYNTQENAYGKCAEATIEMKNRFPELKRVRGHYYCVIWGERTHWWLVDEENNIVDPTAIQFPTKGAGIYDEIDETGPIPTGKCPNCSEYCYDNNYCCSESCHREYADYCSRPY